MLKKLIKFLINDIKTDIQAIKEIITGKGGKRLNEIQDGLKQLDWVDDVIKPYWTIFLIIILAFFCGYIVSGAKYNAEMSNYINNALILVNDEGRCYNLTIEEILTYEYKPYDEYENLIIFNPGINISNEPP